ncbi:MAG: hypothetical protein Tsb0034_08880 [Ekhidna sp.]
MLDILQSIEMIEQFMKDVHSFSDYQNDLKTKSAVERQLSIIGEAVIKYTELESLNHSEKIRGFRNRLIHAYDSIDDTIVWVILQSHLPLLKREVSKKLSS